MAARNLGSTATRSRIEPRPIASRSAGGRGRRRVPRLDRRRRARRQAPARPLPLARGRRGATAHRRRRRGDLRGARRSSPTTTPTCPASTSRCAGTSTATSCAAATRSAARPCAAASRSRSSATSAGASRRGRTPSSRPGDALDVMSPQGTFTSTLDALDGKHVVGIAAGSGITPLMALAHTVLARSETSEFELVYTNRSTLDVMFLEELAELKDRYPSRLALHHVLSREQRTAPLLSGRIDAPKLEHDARRAHPPRDRRRVVPLRAVRARAARRDTLEAQGRRPVARALRAVHDRRRPRRAAARAPGRGRARRADGRDRVHARRAVVDRRQPGRRRTSRSSTPRCACDPTCRSPARAACAAPAGRASSRAASR